MDTQDPTPYQGYYRPQYQQDVRVLKLLREAYFGTNRLILSTLVVGLGGRAASVAIIGESKPTLAFALTVVLTHLCVFFAVNYLVAYRYAKLVAEAKDRPMGYAVGLSIAAALVSPFCFGIFGCAIIQGAASSEFKRLGVAGGVFGVKKTFIDAKIAQLEAAQAPQPDWGQAVSDTPPNG